MGVGILEAVQEEEGPPEEMRKGFYILKEKLKRQSKVTLAWKSKFREENRTVTKLKKERDNYLQAIQSQLLVFESHLKKGRKELDDIVERKDNIIRRQHQLICSLTLALIKREGFEDLKKILPGLKLEKNASEPSKNKIYETVSKNNLRNSNESNELSKDDKKENGVISSSKSDFESLNDSDSAIMMEDAYDSLIALPSGKGEIKVMRSVSDALEIISRGVTSSITNNKNISGSGTQVRRPGHGSLSSTPSCSSEESDESPTSTITKSRIDHLTEAKLSNDILKLDKLCSDLPISSSTPNLYQSSCVSNSQRIQPYASNIWEMNSFACSTPSESCDTSFCQSPACEKCNSTSTTPLASPSQTPTISPSTTPPTSPKSLTDCSKFDYDSDATLSDGQSDDGDSGLGTRLSGSPVDTPVGTPDKFEGSFEKLNHFGSKNYRRKEVKEKETIQVTYNRVMSNHRSVTKPKDVKYKRINKAKSRSLEELRGKLKLYDGKQSISVDLGQSEA